MIDGEARNDATGSRDETRIFPVLLAKPDHRISVAEIDPDALKILHRLHRCGFTAYLCGGAVRDLILGKTPKDFDIVTDARPGQIKKRFGNAYIIGRRFRLAHVHFAEGKVIEVATFRGSDVRNENEAESKPSQPPAEVGPLHIYGTPREDAFRRDMTINALFYDPFTETVIDYVGGIEDLRQKRIRMIGDAGERFTDDPVRIWRALRFAARLGFDLEPSAAEAIAPHLHLLETCPGARLYEELNKDLAYETRPVIEALRSRRVLGRVLGGIGRAYEDNDLLFSRLRILLDIADRAQMSGIPMTLTDMHTLLFWPWAEPFLAGLGDDSSKVLKDAILAAGLKVTLPKLLRADIIQIIIIVETMRRALRTGRMRWSLQKRAHYGPASRLCVLIELERPPEGGESFETLFRKKFPGEEGHGYRRRRRRRRKQPSPGGRGSGGEGPVSAA